MKLHRFFLNNSLGEDLVLKEKPLLHRILNVLKLEIDEKIIIFNDFQDFDFIYNIKSVSKKEILLSFSSSKEKESKSEEIHINLCFSMIKKENFSLILEKCSEIGVNEFTPMISDRTEKKNILNFNLNKSKNIIIKAIEQSDQNIIPTINKPYKIRLFIESLIEKGEINKIFILDLEDFSNFSFRNVKNKSNFIKKACNIYVFIGPEGGWTKEERLFFNKNKLKIGSLGDSNLRAETASIISGWFFKNYFNL